MKCSNCGSEIIERQNYCRECGTRVGSIDQPEGKRDENTDTIPKSTPNSGVISQINEYWGIVVVAVVVIMIFGAVGSDLGLSGGGDVEVQISYGGSWQGAISTEGSSRTISGSGAHSIQVDSATSIVSVNAQKMDRGYGTLTVEILQDGEVVARESTQSPFGVAQVSARV